uniref:Histone-lysine N-methyltransferase SETMAR n=1 Tax=Acrobeloides nanus TaxID=290746 RepID=A0A914D7V4_9BILA
MNAMESGDRPDKYQERTFVQRKQCFVCGGVEQYFGTFGAGKDLVFLDDNAKPHRPRQTQQKIQDMGWEHLEHPPYSPDLSPSDFYLFRSLEHWLRGKSSERSKKCANLLLNSLILRTKNGTAVGSTNSKNNGKK